MTWGISSHDALMLARDRPAEAAERLARDLAELRAVGQRPPFAFGSRRLGRHRGELTCVPLHVVLGDASARSGTCAVPLTHQAAFRSYSWVSPPSTRAADNRAGCRAGRSRPWLGSFEIQRLVWACASL